jgi:hypothetical protein
VVARTIRLGGQLSYDTEVDAMSRKWTRLFLVMCASALATSFQARSGASTARAESSSPAPPIVIYDWVGIAQNTIAPTVVGGATQSAHGAMVPIAMYDAVVAIEGGYEPYTAPVIAPADADVTAAVATAAYRILHERFPAQQESLDKQYASYMSHIPDGQPKLDGTDVGEVVAGQLIAMRAHDGLETCTGLCSTSWVQPTPGPGMFEPFPAGSVPQAADLRFVRPWTSAAPTSSVPADPCPSRLSSTPTIGPRHATGAAAPARVGRRTTTTRRGSGPVKTSS